METAVKIYEFLTNLQLSNETIIFTISMLPVSELRGAIPVGILVLKEQVWTTVLFAYMGNLLPVPFLLLLFAPISKCLSKTKVFKGFFEWLFERTAKRAKMVEKYGAIGLALFVAVPLPITGAWTGAVAATLFRIRFKKAFFSICLGVAIAAAIVTMLTLTGKISLNLISASA